MAVRDLVARAASALVLSSLPWLVLMAQNAPDTAARVGALEQQAQKYLQEQKPQLAIPVLREIVAIDPNNLNAQGNLGVLLFFQNDYPGAIPHMRTALQLQPDLWRIEALLGMAEKRTGDSSAAQNDLERAFPRLDDKNIQIQAGLELVELYSSSAQLGKALVVAAKLEELEPENPKILFAGYRLSRQMMNQSLLGMMMVAPDSAEMHMMMGGELGRQGDQTNAIAQYREAIRLNPALPGAHFELAEQMRLSSDAALNLKAEELYKTATQVNAYDEKAWIQLGSIMAAKGDLTTAETYYRKALALQPNNSAAKTGLAAVLSSTNRIDEAISLLEGAIKDEPSNVQAHYRLSTLYRRAGRSADAEREMEAYRRYKDLQDKLSTVFKQLAGAVRENQAEPK